MYTVRNKPIAKFIIQRIRMRESKDFVSFALSTLFSYGSRLFLFMIVARILGPVDFGTWNTLNLLIIYGSFTNLGSQNGMNREVPLLNGKGMESSAKLVVNSSFWFTFITATVCSILLMTVYNFHFLNQKIREHLLSMSVLFFSWQLYQFYQFVLKSNMKFSIISTQQIIYGVLQFLLLLPLTVLYKLEGFIFGQALCVVIACVFIHFSYNLITYPYLSISIIRYLIKTGFPIMLAGLLFSILTSLDRWIILSFFPMDALGKYSLAILCFNTLSILPSVLSQQMYPRMAYEFGQNNNIANIARLVVQQSVLGELISVPLVIVIYFALPYFVNMFLPAYVPGIPAARVLLLGISVLPIAGAIGNLLNTIGLQIYYTFSQVLAIFFTIFSSVLLIKVVYDVSSVAWGVSIGLFLYVLFLLLIYLLVLNKIIPVRNRD